MDYLFLTNIRFEWRKVIEIKLTHQPSIGIRVTLWEWGTVILAYYLKQSKKGSRRLYFEGTENPGYLNKQKVMWGLELWYWFLIDFIDYRAMTPCFHGTCWTNYLVSGLVCWWTKREPHTAVPSIW